MVHAFELQRLTSSGTPFAGSTQCLGNLALGFLESDSVLGPLGSRNTDHHFGKIQPDGIIVLGRGRVGRSKKPLTLTVCLDQRNFLFGTSRQPQIVQGLLVDREKPTGGPVFRRHIGNGGFVRQGKVIQAIAEELNKFSNDPFATQHLHDGQHKVGCRGPFGQGARKFKAHDLWDQHRHGLPQHGRLRLDTAYTPAQHTQPIYHRRMGIRSNDRIGIRYLIATHFTTEYHAR